MKLAREEPNKYDPMQHVLLRVLHCTPCHASFQIQELSAEARYRQTSAPSRLNCCSDDRRQARSSCIYHNLHMRRSSHGVGTLKTIAWQLAFSILHTRLHLGQTGF